VRSVIVDHFYEIDKFKAQTRKNERSIRRDMLKEKYKNTIKNFTYEKEQKKYD